MRRTYFSHFPEIPSRFHIYIWAVNEKTKRYINFIWRSIKTKKKSCALIRQSAHTHTRSHIESQSCEYIWKESKMNIIRNVVIIIARNKFASATAITQLHAPPHTHLYLILSYKHKLLPIVVKIRRRWVYSCAYVSAMILNGKEKRFFSFVFHFLFVYILMIITVIIASYSLQNTILVSRRPSTHNDAKLYVFVRYNLRIIICCRNFCYCAKKWHKWKDRKQITYRFSVKLWAYQIPAFFKRVSKQTRHIYHFKCPMILDFPS